MTELLYGRNAVRETLRAHRRTMQRLVVSNGVQETGVIAEIIKLAEQIHVP
ncbi:MAG: 23S rRNA (guanosine(2251)-2'-O)-methyltransferase RlmB, partial [Oscillochloris sp.]|nr:23S rRNA (guanosine(2251)-2'-O)-methyltransferase RlmB [Oscillochloris sp.]